MGVPSGRTIGVLGGLTVVVFLLALGTFDGYIAVLAQVLLLATIVAGVLALFGAVSGPVAPALAPGLALGVRGQAIR